MAFPVLTLTHGSEEIRALMGGNLPVTGTPVNLTPSLALEGCRQLEDYILAGRLNIYTDVLKLKPGEELGGYSWNKDIFVAMQPLIHCLEVTLHNAIDYTFAMPGCPVQPDSGVPMPTGSLIYPDISATRPGYDKTNATILMPVVRS